MFDLQSGQTCLRKFETLSYFLCVEERDEVERGLDILRREDTKSRCSNGVSVPHSPSRRCQVRSEVEVTHYDGGEITLDALQWIGCVQISDLLKTTHRGTDRTSQSDLLILDSYRRCILRQELMAAISTQRRPRGATLQARESVLQLSPCLDYSDCEITI